MDNAKFDKFLNQLISLKNDDETASDDFDAEMEPPIDLPDPEALVKQGVDVQFAMYASVQANLLMTASVLQESGSVDDYTEALESAEKTYRPGFPPMTPVTDSYFFGWLLSEMKFGANQDNIGQIALQVFERTGAPDDILKICESVIATRMGIYETIDYSGDQLLVRELVTDRKLVVDTPTEYLGKVGDLRFVRLGPPLNPNIEYHSELTTPYVLRGHTADDWTAYLTTAMPQSVVTADGESTEVEDRLASVFKDDCGAMPWLDFIVRSYVGFEDSAIFLQGIPNDPNSFPDPSSVASSFIIELDLTQAQRRVAADCLPEFTDTFRADVGGKKTIALPIQDWQELDNVIHDGRLATAGRDRTSLRNLGTAIRTAILEERSGITNFYDDPPVTDNDVDSVYRLHIVLNGSQPPIWRRIEVPDCTLAELHYIIQAAMGWTNSHLHEFTIDGNRYSIPHPFGDEPEPELGAGPTDSTDVWLSDLIDTKGDSFSYLYDFGDSWEHTITLEGIEESKLSRDYPWCVTGERRCPPEDCGGIWRYQDLLEIMADAKHTEHAEVVEAYDIINADHFAADEHSNQMQAWFEIAEAKYTGAAFDSDDFDIHADLFDEDGQLDDDVFPEWTQHLERQFQLSPEYDQLPNGHYGYVRCFIDYTVNHLGETPVSLSVAEMEEVLLDIIPRKVMAEPDEAGDMVRELNAFFRFVHREYDVPSAKLLAEKLDKKAEKRLRAELADSSNFGMAKSLFSQGKNAGFDMTTEEGMNKFIQTYNASLPNINDNSMADEEHFEDVVQPIRRTDERTGRNDPCPCGSGKKYKKCCLKS